MKNSVPNILSFLFIFFYLLASSSCIVSEYGTKTKNALVKGSSYVGEKSKSLYQSTKSTLGFKDEKKFL